MLAVVLFAIVGLYARLDGFIRARLSGPLGIWLIEAVLVVLLAVLDLLISHSN